jgi:hypothetical protein
VTLVPASSHSPVVSVVKNLTAAQLAAGANITVVPAISGRTIVPIGGLFEYFTGAVAFLRTRDIGLGDAGGTNALRAPVAFGVLADDRKAFTKFADSTGIGCVISAALEVTTPGNGVGIILTSSLATAGQDFVPGDTAMIDGGNVDGLITVSTVANQFPIVSLVQVSKTFTVTGDASAVITAGTDLRVIRSTGNDGSYTVVSSIFGAGVTVITVNEAIPSAVADGKAEPDDGTGGAILTYALTNAGTGYGVETYNLVAVGPSVGAAASINVPTITLQSDGTARVTVFYAVV